MKETKTIYTCDLCNVPTAPQLMLGMTAGANKEYKPVDEAAVHVCKSCLSFLRSIEVTLQSGSTCRKCGGHEADSGFCENCSRIPG